MILCASSTSIPSRFRITVELSRSVSAISLVSSIEEGLITHTSTFWDCPDLRLLLIGVILEDGAAERTGLSAFSVCFAGAALVAAAAFTGLLAGASSKSSNSSNSSSDDFFFANFSKNFFLGRASSSSSRKSSSSAPSRSSSRNSSSS